MGKYKNSSGLSFFDFIAEKSKKNGLSYKKENFIIPETGYTYKGYFLVPSETKSLLNEFFGTKDREVWDLVKEYEKNGIISN